MDAVRDLSMKCDCFGFRFGRHQMVNRSARQYRFDNICETCEHFISRCLKQRTVKVNIVLQVGLQVPGPTGRGHSHDGGYEPSTMIRARGGRG
jgi:hypothetical protein